MTTIDKLDISIYDLYARRQVMVEQINQQLRLEEAQNIPPQTQVLNLNPELTQLDILLGVVPLNTPWAYFSPPKTKLRRSPFTTYRVASTLGSLEKQAALCESIQNIKCQSGDEEKEKATLLGLFKNLDVLNGWLGEVLGRVCQYLKG